jgi:cytidylate kinase
LVNKINSKQEDIITVDGPAGSGKSTIAKLLSKELGLKYIDTGAMYRAITLLALRNNINCNDEESILRLARKSKIELDSNPLDENKYTVIKLNGIDVTNEIRSKEVGAAVSIVSKLSRIRKHLVNIQRELAKSGKAILEGRDTGSIVFPHAILKVFLTASLEERVKRREIQNKDKGEILNKKTIKKEIAGRDMIDSSRQDSPLIVPDDSIVIDSTKMSIRAVADKIKKNYNERICS